MNVNLIACNPCGKRQRAAVRRLPTTDTLTGKQYTIDVCATHNALLSKFLGEPLTNGARHSKPGPYERGFVATELAATTRPTGDAWRALGNGHAKRRRYPDATKPETAHERKKRRDRERYHANAKPRTSRAHGWGNDLHVLRDGSRVILKGPPFVCSCGKDAKGKPGGFKLFRSLMRHANKQKHAVGKPVPASATK